MVLTKTDATPGHLYFLRAEKIIPSFLQIHFNPDSLVSPSAIVLVAIKPKVPPFF